MNCFERAVSINASLKLRILFFCLSVLCGNSFAQDWKIVADGVEYAQVRREFSGKAVDINLLRLDLKKVRLDVHHALDRAVGTEKTSSIAQRKRAIAAINAGFFRLDKSEFAGDAVGVLRVDKKVLSESSSHRSALMIANRTKSTEIKISRLTTHLILLMRPPRIEKGGVVANTKTKWVPLGVNRERKDNDLVVFTPGFGERTLTSGSGLEILVSKERVIDISHGNDNLIPRQGFVISASGALIDEVREIIAGDGMVFGHRWTYDSVDALQQERQTAGGGDKRFEFEDITNGVPQLIKDGKIDITWEQEKASKSFVETRHPRTAVAKLKDGKFLMLTADGRSEQSAGLDLYDLAKYMLELGAVDAMNLDGGGSTTMYLDGKVVNKPSDKEGERKVGDAILVTLRKRKK